MSTPPKSGSTPHSGVGLSTGLHRVAIVGGGTLKGKEVAEIINDRNFPAADVKLLDDDESLGQLESMGDEVTFIQSVRSEQFDNVDFTFFASDPECTRKNWIRAQHSGGAIIDLSYALEDEPSAIIRAPWIERELGKVLPADLQPGPAVIAHPAAMVLALLLLRTRKTGQICRVVATVFEPASERGQRGMDELHQQTVNLLSFQQLPKEVFDTQIAFNLVARYGENATPTLESIERRIVKHFDQITGTHVPRPSLLTIQAPIFHGHAFSLYLEMEQAIAVGDLAQALTGEHVTVTRLASDSPSNVNAAGQGEVLVSVIPDANSDKGYWLWAASDNLRIAATTAVEAAEALLSSRPRGKIQ